MFYRENIDRQDNERQPHGPPPTDGVVGFEKVVFLGR